MKKKVLIGFVVASIISIYASRVSFQSENNTTTIVSNVEALASENNYEVSHRCFVGDICYVMAEGRRYCGSCSYDYVNPQGDGYCALYGW